VLILPVTPTRNGNQALRLRIPTRYGEEPSQ
jgi:hypothetical protein